MAAITGGRKLKITAGGTTYDLTSYVVGVRPSYELGNTSRVITTLDGQEHAYPSRRRATLSVDLRPMTYAQFSQVFRFLDRSNVWFTVEYDDPYLSVDGATARTMRLVNVIENKWLTAKRDGTKYWNGGTLEFREQ